MGYTVAREHAKKAKTWADAAVGQTDDEAIRKIARAISELAKSQEELITALYSDS